MTEIKKQKEMKTKEKKAVKQKMNYRYELKKGE